jgi:hypothetical protein
VSAVAQLSTGVSGIGTAHLVVTAG